MFFFFFYQSLLIHTCDSDREDGKKGVDEAYTGRTDTGSKEASSAFCPAISMAQTLQARQHLIEERPELCDLGERLHLPDLLPHLQKEINLTGLM